MNGEIFGYLEELMETLERRSDDSELESALHCAKTAYEKFKNKVYADIAVGGLYTNRKDNTQYEVGTLAENLQRTGRHVVIWKDGEPATAYVVDAETFIKDFELSEDRERGSKWGEYPFI